MRQHRPHLWLHRPRRVHSHNHTLNPSTGQRGSWTSTQDSASASSQKETRANLHLFKGNLDEPSFRLWKTSHLLLKAKQHLTRLAQLYPDSTLTLFGSCATGTDGPGSDLDLLLITRRATEPPPSLIGQLSDQVERDVQILKFAPEEWEKRIQGQQAILRESNHRRHSLERQSAGSSQLNVEDCFKRRLLRKEKPDPQKAERSMEVANAKLGQSSKSLQFLAKFSEPSSELSVNSGR